MHFTWLESMSVGVEALDEQHKQLIKIYNDFIEACSNKKGLDELEHSLNFLVDYAIKHFAAEEAIQFRQLYPNCAEHRKMHEGFKQKVAGIVEKFKKEGPTPSMINTFNLEVGAWIVDHIAKEDKKVGDFFRSKQGG